MDTTRNTQTGADSDTAMHLDTTANPEYSNIVGVFRDRKKAEQAIEALKQAGISDDQPQLTVYEPHAGEAAADSTGFESVKRFIVQIRAVGREKDAVEVLIGCGANNSDLPLGTTLVHGSIINSKDAIADSVPVNSAAESHAESFFG